MGFQSIKQASCQDFRHLALNSGEPTAKLVRKLLRQWERPLEGIKTARNYRMNPVTTARPTEA